MWLDLIATFSKASLEQKIVALLIPLCILLIGYAVMDYIERR
jgi:hypothetical protein